ncbi:T9SS type A sorting domain-containing protein, partial [Arthrospira platensis SPKY1]|nr:T9SS type A sorting domain-containing protein [Arthrospira platensis SPKY1]
AKSASFEDIKIEAFPNPAGETLYVRIHGGAASYKLAVVNAFGQEVAWAEASGTGVAVAIDMSRHPGGLYFVSAANEVGRIVGAVKVVRQ